MNEMYEKLVDLYAGRELPLEMEAQLEDAASVNPALARNMRTLRDTVELLQGSQNSIEFTEESYQRILMKLYARGAEVQPAAATPAHLQYYLPIQG